MKTFYQFTAFIFLVTSCRPELTSIPCANIYDMALYKKADGARSEWRAVSTGDTLGKFCNAFADSKEMREPTIERDWAGYKLNIWFNDRSMLDLDIIFTQHYGTVIRNGKKYYRNNELVALTEKMFSDP